MLEEETALPGPSAPVFDKESFMEGVFDLSRALEAKTQNPASGGGPGVNNLSSPEGLSLEEGRGGLFEDFGDAGEGMEDSARHDAPGKEDASFLRRPAEAQNFSTLEEEPLSPADFTPVEFLLCTLEQRSFRKTDTVKNPYLN